jgi:pyruvate,water dikinase
VRQLSEAAIDAYVSLVSGIIPAAWMSEAWFTLTYKLVKRKGDPPAPTYLMGYDSTPIQAEKALYDLARWVGEGTSLGIYLRESDTSELISDLGSDHVPPDVDQDEWQAWKTRFQVYLKNYGHMIYNLDFGNPVPADDPAPVLDTFKLFLDGQGGNPHERQGATAKRREEATQDMLMRLKGRRRKSFLKNLERAQKYAPLREDGLADVGLSYPLLREMLRELGSRFTEGGMIEGQDDIFWLTEDEVLDASARLDRGEALQDLSEFIPGRKAIWRAARRLTPPMALIRITLFGKDLMRTKSKRVKGGQGDTLKGVAASPGSATGPACVINGPEDFSKMRSGDILIAPLTTPAWTPLFARASAIVTDVGGPLSHGSIVAREYGIPTVLGTGGATKRIHSGQDITVDGSAGTVRLSENGKDDL